MARTFQLVQIFPQLTVAETIAAAVVSRQSKRWRLFSRLSGDAAMARVSRDRRDFGLGPPARHRRAAALAGREEAARRRVRLRARPEVILLDEPTSGVSTAEKHGIMKT